MGGSYLACSLFSQRSSVHYISFIKSNGSYNKVNPSSGHLAAVSKGWDLGRYQGTSGVTAPSALTGQDPHLKYLPLVGLCVFCSLFFFPKQVECLCISLSCRNCLCANYSSVSDQRGTHQRIANSTEVHPRKEAVYILFANMLALQTSTPPNAAEKKTTFSESTY